MITTLEDSYGPRSSSQRGGTPPTPRTATVVDASYRDQRALNNEVRVHLKILIPINQEALHRCNPNPELDGEVGPQHSAHHRNKKPTQNPPELTTTFTISQTPPPPAAKGRCSDSETWQCNGRGPQLCCPRHVRMGSSLKPASPPQPSYLPCGVLKRGWHQRNR